MSRGKKRVNVYALARRFGGPEEGGWWYDAGHPVLTVTISSTDGQVDDRDTLGHAAFAIRNALVAIYPDTGSRYSVLGGDDYRVVIEANPPQPWPRERPHYE